MEQVDITRDDSKNFKSWDDVTSDDIEQLQKALKEFQFEYNTLVDRMDQDESGSEFLGYRALYLHSLIEESEAIIKEWNKHQSLGFKYFQE